MQERPDPAALAEAVKGLSDEELVAQVKKIGVDDALAQIFAGMEDAFTPEKAKGENATIQYEIDTDEGAKHWQVQISDGTCKTVEGQASDPKVTLKMALPDFVRLIFNQVQGPQLFMRGKLKLQGDMMYAMKMQGFFERRF